METLAAEERLRHPNDVAQLGERLVELAGVEPFDDTLAAGAESEDETPLANLVDRLASG